MGALAFPENVIVLEVPEARVEVLVIITGVGFTAFVSDPGTSVCFEVFVGTVNRTVAGTPL